MATPQHRSLLRRIPGQDASDGAGVRLKRSIGSTPALRLDPFLMLDAFRTDNPDDYIAGFPAHPHRGFETVTEDHPMAQGGAPVFHIYAHRP